MKLLNNKKAIITGGSEGIGLGIAEAFLANGVEELILIARDELKLEKVKSRLSLAYNKKISTVPFNLYDIQEIPTLIDKTAYIFKDADILVNNAGSAFFLPFEQITLDELNSIIDLNVKAPFVLTQKIVPYLKPESGCVINISSYFTSKMIKGRPSSAYSLTKGALDSLTKALASELGPNGIRVNGIAPGSVDTPLLHKTIKKMSKSEINSFNLNIKNNYPLGRIGNVNDIGSTAAFLASDMSKWITGSIIKVDGGFSVT